MTRMLMSSPAIDAVANWWDEINESVVWQDGIFYSLCAAYALVSSVALVSLQYYHIDFVGVFACVEILLSDCALPNLSYMENASLGI